MNPNVDTTRRESANEKERERKRISWVVKERELTRNGVSCEGTPSDGKDRDEQVSEDVELSQTLRSGLTDL